MTAAAAVRGPAARPQLPGDRGPVAGWLFDYRLSHQIASNCKTVEGYAEHFDWNQMMRTTGSPAAGLSILPDLDILPRAPPATTAPARGPSAARDGSRGQQCHKVASRLVYQMSRHQGRMLA